MAKFKKIEAQSDGWSDWELPEMNGYRMACCDCGLVHDIDFKVVKATPDGSGGFNCEDVEGYRVLMRARRNNRSTAQIRRHERDDTNLDSYAKVRNLMKQLHDLNVSTTYAAQEVWEAISGAPK